MFCSKGIHGKPYVKIFVDSSLKNLVSTPKHLKDTKPRYCSLPNLQCLWLEYDMSLETVWFEEILSLRESWESAEANVVFNLTSIFHFQLIFYTSSWKKYIAKENSFSLFFLFRILHRFFYSTQNSFEVNLRILSKAENGISYLIYSNWSLQCKISQFHLRPSFLLLQNYLLIFIYQADLVQKCN